LHLFALAENRLVVNPVDGVELPSVTSVEQRFLTLEQLHTLANAAEEHRPLVYLLGTCGLRFGEVAELRWRDVDLDGLRLRVARSVTLVDGRFVIGLPKSAHGRTVSLPKFVGDLLEPGEPSALVFPDSEGGHMRAVTFVDAGGRRPSRLPSYFRARSAARSSTSSSFMS
jgi:integrase